MTCEIHLFVLVLVWTQNEYYCNLIIIRPYVSDNIKCHSIFQSIFDFDVYFTVYTYSFIIIDIYFVYLETILNVSIYLMSVCQNFLRRFTKQIKYDWLAYICVLYTMSICLANINIIFCCFCYGTKHKSICVSLEMCDRTNESKKIVENNTQTEQGE